MDDLPIPVNGACSKCGSSRLLLARDKTEYSPCEFDADTGKWFPQYTDTEESAASKSVRFYCMDCQTNHAVPVELE